MHNKKPYGNSQDSHRVQKITFKKSSMMEIDICSLQNSHLKVSFNRNLLMSIFISSGLSRLYVTVLVQTVGKNILSLKEKIQVLSAIS